MQQSLVWKYEALFITILDTMKITVEKDTTLLSFLLDTMSNRSRTSVKSYLVHGQVAVNGCQTTRHDTLLVPGDIVEISMKRMPEVLHHPLLRIVYEDERLLVVDKRNGLLSVGTDKEQKRTAFYILSEHIKKNNRGARLFVVHRLDRETSGLMIYAKDQTTQEILQRNWRSMVLDRRYVAVVENKLPNSEGIIDTILREDRNCKVWASLNGAGERAVTHYSVIKEGKDYSLVELSLETGKKNQIRAHMEWMHTPIAGDKKYSAASNPIGRVCLHAYKLCFVHPETGKCLNFSTGIPKMFEEVVDGVVVK